MDEEEKELRANKEESDSLIQISKTMLNSLYSNQHFYIVCKYREVKIIQRHNNILIH